MRVHTLGRQQCAAQLLVVAAAAVTPCKVQLGLAAATDKSVC